MTDEVKTIKTQRRTFVLYCHIIDPKDAARLLEYPKDPARNPIREGIRTILKNDKGLLILFLDTGLGELLRMIHPIRRESIRTKAKEEKQKLKNDFFNRSVSLQNSQRLGDDLEEKLGPNVRVLTALDLVDVFGEMSDAENLKKFLMGTNDEIRYDTPKFMESIVRLRMIGSRVPVLRLDQDVLIPPDPKEFDQTALQLAIKSICEAVETHHHRTQILATILSANYQTPSKDDGDMMRWNRGYATRILPSLLLPIEEDTKRYLEAKKKEDAKKKEAEEKEKEAEEKKKYWEPELQARFNHVLTEKFLHGLWEWGAPRTAVISGALLYMNDAVVLNVPPFSNFSQRVMWIDDHLRYVLHREMGDFCRQTQVELDTDEPLHVFYGEVKVCKHRMAEEFLLYAVRTYLPSLLWGSFFDFWLCQSTILKKREVDLTEEEHTRWAAQRRDGYPGTLAKAVREARAGCLPDEGKLREDLKKEANDRLGKLREVWGNLMDGRDETIASAWVHDAFPQSLKDALDSDTPKIDAKLPEKVEDFKNGLEDGFNKLLDDTCRYVKWVFEWPHVVSVIRSVPPGEFRSDLEWTPTP